MIGGGVAALLVAVAAYASHALALSVVREPSRSLRWVAAALLGSACATALFQLLASLGQFRLIPALLAVLAAAAVARFLTGVSVGRILDLLAEDAAEALRLVAGEGGPVSRGVRLALASFCVLACLRALSLPPLGHDALTYHAVKAAMWVQTGGELPLATPGGWSFYRYFLSGGEIFGAWAMLPFHADTLYLLVDVAFWLGLGATLWALARELSIARELAPSLCFYLLMMPAVYFWVGSGYVDIPLHFFVLSGVLFTLRAMGSQEPAADAFLSLLAFGCACGIKVTALPLPGLAVLAICTSAWRSRRVDAALLGSLALAGLAVILLLAPSWLRNAAELGHPLSPYPVQIGSLVLGEASPGVEWYSRWSAADAPTEMSALAKLFGLELRAEASLGPLSLLLLALMPLGFLTLLRRRPIEALVLLAMIFGLALPYFSSAFTPVRLYWARSNGRLLADAMILAALVAAARPWPRQLGSVRVVLIVAGLASPVAVAVNHVGSAEWPGLMLSLLLLPLLLLALVWARSLVSRESWKWGLIGLAVMLFAAGSPMLQRYREKIRYQVPLDSIVGHSRANYWTDLARLTDQPGRSHRIAVAAGPYKSADNEYLYFFMGRYLQNELHYVSPSRDGRLVPFRGYDDLGPEQVDADAWHQRLRDRGITHVAGLFPPWHEVLWMGERKDRYELLVAIEGVMRRNSGLLFRVKGEDE